MHKLHKTEKYCFKHDHYTVISEYGCYKCMIDKIKELENVKDYCEICGCDEFLCGHNKRD